MKIIKPEDWPIDPEVAKLTVDQIDNDIAELTSILDGRASEEVLHQFLASHTYFFESSEVLNLYDLSPLYSKVKLGDEYVMDFCCFRTYSFGPQWLFVEIESPSSKLFLKNGNFSSKANHAIEQAKDWSNWVARHLDEAQKKMPLIDFVRSFVFIGRRREYTQKAVQKLRRENFKTNSGEIIIHSLDWFLDKGKQVKARVESLGNKGNWNIPLKALSNSDLKDGLPLDAVKWMHHIEEMYIANKEGKEYHKSFLRDNHYFPE